MEISHTVEATLRSRYQNGVDVGIQRTQKTMQQAMNAMSSASQGARRRVVAAFEAKRRQAQQLMRAFRDLLNNSKRLDEIGGKLTSFGQKATLGVTLPLVAAFTFAVGAASGFEAKMNQVEAVTQANVSQMAALNAQSRELGAATRFSASEAAAGQAFLGQAGFKTNEIIAAMPGLLSLAAAGQLDLAEAADIASNVLSGFRENADQTNRVADILAATAASSNTSVRQLGAALKLVAPIATDVNLSIEQTAALVGFLGNAGLQATVAGTSLRGAIAALLDPSDEARAIFKRLGVEITDQSGNLRNLIDIFGDLGEAQAGPTDLVKVFGREVAAAASILSNAGGPALRDYAKQLQAVEGFSKRSADTISKGLTGSFTEFASAVEGLQIALVSSGIGVLLEEIVRAATDVIRAISELPDPVLAAGAAFGLFAGSIGPLLIGIGKLLPLLGSGGLLGSLGALIPQLGAATAAATGFQLATVGIATFFVGAFAAAIAVTLQNLKDLKEEFRVQAEVAQFVNDLKSVGVELEREADEGWAEYERRVRQTAEALELQGATQGRVSRTFDETGRQLAEQRNLGELAALAAQGNASAMNLLKQKMEGVNQAFDDGLPKVRLMAEAHEVDAEAAKRAAAAKVLLARQTAAFAQLQAELNDREPRSQEAQAAIQLERDLRRIQNLTLFSEEARNVARLAAEESFNRRIAAIRAEKADVEQAAAAELVRSEQAASAAVERSLTLQRNSALDLFTTIEDLSEVRRRAAAEALRDLQLLEAALSGAAGPELRDEALRNLPPLIAAVETRIAELNRAKFLTPAQVAELAKLEDTFKGLNELDISGFQQVSQTVVGIGRKLMENFGNLWSDFWANMVDTQKSAGKLLLASVLNLIAQEIRALAVSLAIKAAAHAASLNFLKAAAFAAGAAVAAAGAGALQAKARSLAESGDQSSAGGAQPFNPGISTGGSSSSSAGLDVGVSGGPQNAGEARTIRRPPQVMEVRLKLDRGIIAEEIRNDVDNSGPIRGILQTV